MLANFRLQFESGLRLPEIRIASSVIAITPIKPGAKNRCSIFKRHVFKYPSEENCLYYRPRCSFSASEHLEVIGVEVESKAEQ